MSDIIGRIFGKKKSKDESVAQIRSTVNKLTFRSRGFERQAMEYMKKPRRVSDTGTRRRVSSTLADGRDVKLL